MSRRTDAVLVTGGCGYLGSRLVRELAARSPETTIRILDNLGSGRLEALQSLPRGRFEFVEGDILDPSSRQRALQGVTAVVHLAAIARTPFGFHEPDWLEQVNHWGTAQLVESAIDAGVGYFLLASSAAVYGPGQDHLESSARRPLGPYGRSKFGAERVVEAASERGLGSGIVRLGSLFGLAPVTRFDAVANRFAYLVGVGRALPVFGTGEQRRALVHVRDAAGFMADAAVKRLEGTWNLAATNASVNDIVEALRSNHDRVRVRHTETDHLTHLSLGVDTAQLGSLGWRARIGLQEGLAEVVESFAGVGEAVVTGLGEEPISLD